MKLRANPSRSDAALGLKTLAAIQEKLGSIPLERIQLDPAPGMATEDDLIARHEKEDRLFELVDGILVEKGMGFYEARLAVVLARYLEAYLEKKHLGIAVGSDGMMRLAPGLVRIPDVSFLSWKRFPGKKLPSKPIPPLAPDLAVEVLSESNTPSEMARKLREYFAAGTQLAWLVDPKTRTAKVYDAAERCKLVSENGKLDGGKLLPVFSLSLKKLFRQAGDQERP